MNKEDQRDVAVALCLTELEKAKSRNTQIALLYRLWDQAWILAYAKGYDRADANPRQPESMGR